VKSMKAETHDTEVVVQGKVMVDEVGELITPKLVRAVFDDNFLRQVGGEQLIQTQAAVRFNDAMVDASKKVGVALLEFKVEDPDDMKKARAEAQRVLKDVRAELKELPVFPSPTGKKLYDAHQRLLDTYEQIVEKDLDEMVKVVEDKKLKLEERKAQLLEIGKRI